MQATTSRMLALVTALAALGALPAAWAAEPSVAASPAVPRLTASPVAVRPGTTLTLTGRGFAASAHLTLLVRRPHGHASRMGAAVTGIRGGFVATIRIRARAAAGAFEAVACQDACRVQAGVRFRIVSG
ncbi:MAG TPA: hypothetical protein VFU94_04925 [Conexibacter sp.]|nr:hypothetical protein [Conexibacter sp.]